LGKGPGPLQPRSHPEFGRRGCGTLGKLAGSLGIVIAASLGERGGQLTVRLDGEGGGADGPARVGRGRELRFGLGPTPEIGGGPAAVQLNRTEVAGVARPRDGVTAPVGQQPVAQQGDIIVLAEGSRHHRPDNPGRDPEVGRRPPRGHRAGPPVGHRRIVQPAGFRQYQGGTDVAEQLVTPLSGVGRRVGQHSEAPVLS